MIFSIVHNNEKFEYRVGQLSDDGLYKLVDKTYVKVDITEDLQVLIDSKISTYNFDNYAELRKIEYDKLNQLEMQYDDLINGTTTWKDSINAIKLQYPKPME